MEISNENKMKNKIKLGKVHYLKYINEVIILYVFVMSQI